MSLAQANLIFLPCSQQSSTTKSSLSKLPALPTPHCCGHHISLGQASCLLPSVSPSVKWSPSTFQWSLNSRPSPPTPPYFANKSPSSQGYGFSSGHVWTIKKPERQRIDAFELWCWRGLLRVPWTARRSNQSTLKEISPEYHWKD